MKEYIEDIIEIILENVSCEHPANADHSMGVNFDDPTYCLENEKTVIEKCLKVISNNICLSNGHDFFVIASKTTDRSTIGWLRCCRCPEEERFQFDY